MQKERGDVLQLKRRKRKKERRTGRRNPQYNSNIFFCQVRRKRKSISQAVELHTHRYTHIRITYMIHIKIPLYKSIYVSVSIYVEMYEVSYPDRGEKEDRDPSSSPSTFFNLCMRTHVCMYQTTYIYLYLCLSLYIYVGVLCVD